MTVPDDIPAAVELNFAALLEWYASFPGGSVDRAPDRTICLTNVPFRATNAVVRSDLRAGTEDDRIQEATSRMAGAGHPWRWLVGPTARPADLETLLARAGLRLVSDTPGMALEMPGPPVAPAHVDGLLVRPLADEADLDAWAELQRGALDLDQAAVDAWRTVHARPGFGPAVALQTWIALHDGRAVGSAAVFVAEGVAGVYNVATLPSMRGRGIGRMLTARVMEVGRRAGARVAVLGSSAMGLPVYTALGFREVCRLRSWTAAEPAP